MTDVLCSIAECTAQTILANRDLSPTRPRERSDEEEEEEEENGERYEEKWVEERRNGRERTREGDGEMIE